MPVSNRSIEYSNAIAVARAIDCLYHHVRPRCCTGAGRRRALRSSLSDRVQEALAISLRGCAELLPQADWVKKLQRWEATGVPLRIKFGMDPTAPDLHLGHTVVLNKMRQLQDLGLAGDPLIGDFTTTIGDPSGRNSTRPPLTREQIEANAETYFEQAAWWWTWTGPRCATTASGATRWARAA
jgi:hypothetical protein